MAVKVAINGFGRIGRNVLRAIIESGRKDIEVVAINDLGPVETNAHLLRFDSVHGRFPATVTTSEDSIDVGRGPMRVTAIRNPADLPWSDVDVVMECTGIFTSKEACQAHLDNGSSRVLISCLSPVAKVLNDAIGIKKGFMTTIHSYTGDQPTLDTMHKDLYRARAAALSMIPTSTGAAKASKQGNNCGRGQCRYHRSRRRPAERCPWLYRLAFGQLRLQPRPAFVRLPP